MLGVYVREKKVLTLEEAVRRMSGYPAQRLKVDHAGRWSVPPEFDYNVEFMPLYRIYRMKDSPRQQFRWAPHVAGCASVKPRDYEQRGQVEALNEYDAWRGLRESGDPLAVGDLVETEAGQLRICKYVGFEPAQWVLPEPKQSEPEPEPAGQSTAS